MRRRVRGFHCDHDVHCDQGVHCDRDIPGDHNAVPAVHGGATRGVQGRVFDHGEVRCSGRNMRDRGRDHGLDGGDAGRQLP